MRERKPRSRLEGLLGRTKKKNKKVNFNVEKNLLSTPSLGESLSFWGGENGVCLGVFDFGIFVLASTVVVLKSTICRPGGLDLTGDLE